MSKLKKSMDTWNQSAEWCFERVENELSDKVDEINRLLGVIENLEERVCENDIKELEK